MLMKKWYVWLALIFLPLLAGLWLTKGQQPPHIHAIASYQLTLIMILRRFLLTGSGYQAKSGTRPIPPAMVIFCSGQMAINVLRQMKRRC